MFGTDVTLRAEVNRVIEHINECGAQTDVTLTALLLLLTEKGVFTHEEFANARLRAINPSEQARAKKTAAARANEPE